MTGSQTGIADIGKRLEAQDKECPDEKFALVGYSQGGMVVMSAIPKLPKNLQDKVVAVVLYGAGDGSAVSGALKAKTLANCAPGDFVSLPIGLWLSCSLANKMNRLVRKQVAEQGTFRTTTRTHNGMIALLNTSSRHSMARMLARS